jgi:sporulation protein YlmC with PRC-barrel domain
MPVFAQERQGEPKPHQPQQGERQPVDVPTVQRPTGERPLPVTLDRSLIRDDVLIGGNVYRAQTGAKVKEDKLGSISDLVIDGRTGKVRYGVLATGGTLGLGKTHLAVRWDHLAWKEMDKCFTLALDEDSLHKLPKFDPKFVESLPENPGPMEQAENPTKPIDHGNVNHGNARNDTSIENDDRNDTDKAQHDANAVRSDRPQGSLMLASKIDGGEVSASGEKIGETEHLLIEPDSGQVVLVTLASGGVLGLGETKYVVPWTAMTFNESAKQEVSAVISNKNKAAFETAPKLSDEGADVNKTDFQNRVFTFYGVQYPRFEGQPATPPPAPPREGSTPPPGRDH